MSFIKIDFSDDELLLRAVYPANRRPEFWENGRLSSAALKDSRGLSVERTAERPLPVAIDYIRNHLTGIIVSISVNSCRLVEAAVCYLPSPDNPFHCEIHGSETEILLSDLQALFLARNAKCVYMPDYSVNIS